MILLFLTAARAGVGAWVLTDAGGLSWAVNDDVSGVEDSSASGAVSDATFTAAVPTSTSAGGLESWRGEDAYDGYGGLLVNGQSYQGNGPGALSCGGRVLELPAQVMGDLVVRREVFVPEDDRFLRWLNIVENRGATAVALRLEMAGNLGSDGDTVVVATGDGDDEVEEEDGWAITMEAWSEGRSRDPRLLHVWGNAEARAPALGVDIDDNDPSWARELVLGPGEVAVEMSFAAGAGTTAELELLAEQLSALGGSALDCLSQERWEQVVNIGVDCGVLVSDCSAGGYDLATGICSGSPVREGEACDDDGLGCVSEGVCQGGLCIGPPPEEVAGDGRDGDCDGRELCLLDEDQDGYANSEGRVVESGALDCAGPGLASLDSPQGDCDDTDPQISPGAQEICDESDQDEDCDGFADNADHTVEGQSSYFGDTDGDGYGDPERPVQACDLQRGVVDNALDCDDYDRNMFPSAPEVVGDGLDQDCDGADAIPGKEAGAGCGPGLAPAPGLALLAGLLLRRRLGRHRADPARPCGGRRRPPIAP